MVPEETRRLDPCENGGGIHIEHAHATVSGNIVTGNVAQGSGGGFAGYVQSWGQLVNNLIYKNQALRGGGLFLKEEAHWETVNNTICSNSATYGGGIYIYFSHVELMDCILWGNEAADGPQLALYSWGPVNVTYCDVQGGEKAIGGEPGSVNYRYLYNIDAGIPDTTGVNLPLYDLAGNPRIINDRVDIGAYEHQCLSAVEDRDGSGRTPPLSVTLYGRRIDPSGMSIRMGYMTPARGHVSLNVYDLTGRHVRTLVDEVRPAGRHPVVWDGRNGHGHRVPAGVHFCRLVTHGERRTLRLLLIH